MVRAGQFSLGVSWLGLGSAVLLWLGAGSGVIAWGQTLQTGCYPLRNTWGFAIASTEDNRLVLWHATLMGIQRFHLGTRYGWFDSATTYLFWSDSIPLAQIEVLGTPLHSPVATVLLQTYVGGFIAELWGANRIRYSQIRQAAPTPPGNVNTLYPYTVGACLWQDTLLEFHLLGTTHLNTYAYYFGEHLVVRVQHLTSGSTLGQSAYLAQPLRKDSLPFSPGLFLLSGYACTPKSVLIGGCIEDTTRAWHSGIFIVSRQGVLTDWLQFQQLPFQPVTIHILLDGQYWWIVGGALTLSFSQDSFYLFGLKYDPVSGQVLTGWALLDTVNPSFWNYPIVARVLYEADRQRFIVLYHAFPQSPSNAQPYLFFIREDGTVQRAYRLDSVVFQYVYPEFAQMEMMRAPSGRYLLLTGVRANFHYALDNYGDGVLMVFPLQELPDSGGTPGCCTWKAVSPSQLLAGPYSLDGMGISLVSGDTAGLMIRGILTSTSPMAFRFESGGDTVGWLTVGFWDTTWNRSAILAADTFPIRWVCTPPIVLVTGVHQPEAGEGEQTLLRVRAVPEGLWLTSYYREPVQVTLVTPEGKVVARRWIASHQRVFWSLAYLPPGMYWLRWSEGSLAVLLPVTR